MTNIIQIVDSQLVTNSLILAREFGRRHTHILQSIRELVEAGALRADDFSFCDYMSVQNKVFTMYTLTERGMLIALPFVIGKEAKRLQSEFIEEYLTKGKNRNAFKRSLLKKQLKRWLKKMYWQIKILRKK